MLLLCLIGFNKFLISLTIHLFSPSCHTGLRTRIHNHSTPSERVFCRPAALKNLAIHKVLSAFFRLAGQQNPSPIRHPLIMNTGSKFYAIFCSGLGAGASRRLTYVRRCGGSQKIAGSRGSETASVWFQTKLTGAKRLPRGFSGFQPEARHPPRRPCGLSCGLGVSDPSPQAPPRQARRISYFLNLKFYSIFFKKLRGRGAEPPTRSALRAAAKRFERNPPKAGS